MTKNTITVIDQELIDYIESAIESKSIDVGMVAISRISLQELLPMAKDLIEINAELTKRKQKMLSLINDGSWNGYNAVDVIDALNVILKGE